MTLYTANVEIPDRIDLGAVDAMMSHAGYAVAQVPQAHGVIVNAEADDLDAFLDALDVEIAPVGGIIHDYGEATVVDHWLAVTT